MAKSNSNNLPIINDGVIFPNASKNSDVKTSSKKFSNVETNKINNSYKNVCLKSSEDIENYFEIVKCMCGR